MSTEFPVIPALSLSEGEEILHVAKWSSTGVWALHVIVTGPMALVAMHSLGQGYNPFGFGAAFLAALIFSVAQSALSKHFAVVTTHNVAEVSGATSTVKKIPLEQIIGVQVSPSMVTVTAGSIFGALNLGVANTKELAEWIEKARLAKRS